MKVTRLQKVIIVLRAIAMIFFIDSCGYQQKGILQKNKELVNIVKPSILHPVVSTHPVLKERPVVGFHPRYNMAVFTVNNVSFGENYKVTLFKQQKGKLPSELITKTMESAEEFQVAMIHENELDLFRESNVINEPTEATHSFLIVTEFERHGKKYELFDEVIYQKHCHTRLIRCTPYSWGPGKAVAFEKTPTLHPKGCSHTRGIHIISNKEVESSTFSLVNSPVSMARGIASFVDDMGRLVSGVHPAALNDLGQLIAGFERRHNARILPPEAEPYIRKQNYTHEFPVTDYYSVDQLTHFLREMDEAFTAMEKAGYRMPTSKGQGHLDIYLVRDSMNGTNINAGHHNKLNRSIVLDITDPRNDIHDTVWHEMTHGMDAAHQTPGQGNARALVTDLTLMDGETYIKGRTDNSSYFRNNNAGSSAAEEIAEIGASLMKHQQSGQPLTAMQEHKLRVVQGMSQGNLEVLTHTPEFKLKKGELQLRKEQEIQKAIDETERHARYLDEEVDAGRMTDDVADELDEARKIEETREIDTAKRRHNEAVAEASYRLTSPLSQIPVTRPQAQIELINKALGTGAVVGVPGMIALAEGPHYQLGTKGYIADREDSADPQSEGFFAHAYRRWTDIQSKTDDEGMRRLATTMKFFLEGPNAMDIAANRLGHTINEINDLETQLGIEEADPGVQSLLALRSTTAIMKDVGYLALATGMTAAEFLPGTGPALRALGASKRAQAIIKSIPGAIEVLTGEKPTGKAEQSRIIERPTMCVDGKCTGSQIADTFGPANRALQDQLEQLAADPELIAAAARAVENGVVILPQKPISIEEAQALIQKSDAVEPGDSITLSPAEMNSISERSQRQEANDLNYSPVPEKEKFQIPQPEACMMNLMEEVESSSSLKCN